MFIQVIPLIYYSAYFLSFPYPITLLSSTLTPIPYSPTSPRSDHSGHSGCLGVEVRTPPTSSTLNSVHFRTPFFTTFISFQATICLQRL